MDTTIDGPVTRSDARAKHIIFPESVPLSDSDEDVSMIPRRISLVAYGASQSPAAFAKMSANVMFLFLSLLQLEVKWNSLASPVLRPSCLASVVASS